MMKSLFTTLIVVCALVLLLYLSLLPDRSPRVNKIMKMENGYELSDTTHYCNGKCKQYFSTIKTTQKEEINVTDACHNCGKPFSAHHVNWVWWYYETDEVSNGL